ncbi:unnamed protein product [Rotaria sordida]|uniref:RBR-type E3 ubiquitin transferase n=1 Tax=Rotaria sordida TaxID=392033 RepID=A0A818ZN57_9BILA|nr:unnamed protein product [Rotaria sordida]
MDNIGQQHDILRRDIDQDNINKTLFEQIDGWEKESIENIRSAAETVRIDLKQLTEESKKRLNNLMNKLSDELRSNQESDDYKEDDLDRWSSEIMTTESARLASAYGCWSRGKLVTKGIYSTEYEKLETLPNDESKKLDIKLSESVVPKESSPFPKERQGTCSICNDDNLTLVTLSKQCQHEAACCIPCLTQNISNGITAKGIHRFECPMPTCKVLFESSEYYCLLDARLIAVVDKLLLNRFLESNEEFRWCKSRKGCGAGQLVSNYKDLLGYYTCYACYQPLCFRHAIEWHTGYTCDEFDRERTLNPDLASDVTVLAFTKQCPNQSCRTPIMKFEGCDVMTCCRYGTHTCIESKGKCDHGGQNYCGQKFCWKCLGKIDIDKKTGAYIRHCNQNCEYATLNN